MKNLKKWITSPTGTIALFVLAAGLLLFSTIGSAWAAFKYFSEIYTRDEYYRLNEQACKILQSE